MAWKICSDLATTVLQSRNGRATDPHLPIWVYIWVWMTNSACDSLVTLPWLHSVFECCKGPIHGNLSWQKSISVLCGLNFFDVFCACVCMYECMDARVCVWTYVCVCLSVMICKRCLEQDILSFPSAFTDCLLPLCFVLYCPGTPPSLFVTTFKMCWMLHSLLLSWTEMRYEMWLA